MNLELPITHSPPPSLSASFTIINPIIPAPLVYPTNIGAGLDCDRPVRPVTSDLLTYGRDLQWVLLAAHALAEHLSFTPRAPSEPHDDGSVTLDGVARKIELCCPGTCRFSSGDVSRLILTSPRPHVFHQRKRY